MRQGKKNQIAIILNLDPVGFCANKFEAMLKFRKHVGDNLTAQAAFAGIKQMRNPDIGMVE